MNRTKYLQGPCGRCGGQIDYPAEMVGTRAECPHCGQETDLRLGAPPAATAVSRTVILWTGAAILILVLGLAALLVALKRAEKLSARRAANPTNVVVNPR